MAINPTRYVNVTVNIRPPEPLDRPRLLDRSIPVRTCLFELSSLHACIGGTARFLEQVGINFPFSDFVLASSLVGGCNTMGDLLWLLDKKLGKAALAHVAYRASLLVHQTRYVCAATDLSSVEIFLEFVINTIGDREPIYTILRDVFDNGLPNT